MTDVKLDARKPVLALAIGDPAGVGPELAARVITDPEIRAAADLIVVGDRRVLSRGAEVAGVKVAMDVCHSSKELRDGHGTVLVDLGHLDPVSIEVGVASKEGGAFALKNFRTCIELAAVGQAGAVCFTPFNKAAMRMAHPSYDDEIGYGAEVLGTNAPASEFNILEKLWNGRVTSHVPLSGVAALITRASVLKGIRLMNASLRDAGFAPPRIAVAGLNPHAGDGGNFGREEIETIEPAIEEAKREGIKVEGPFPPDTVFVRATKGAFDGVLTMYHDQGQIAMKLIGFDSGVTLLGGFDFPMCTPAHGSAYDIAGKGIANIGASKAALLLAAKMAAKRGRQAAAA
jgi:4-hydroxythreonine-4-phosphate dehydrogenase